MAFSNVQDSCLISKRSFFWVGIQNTEELHYILWSITPESSTLALHQDFPAEFQATTKQTQDKIQPVTYLSNTLNTVFNTKKQLVAKFIVLHCVFCKLRRSFGFLCSVNYLRGPLRKQMFTCDWCISIHFVCFCLSRFVACDRPVLANS